MAYHNASGTASNTADFLVHLKDFLVRTVGWSLHDDRSGDAEPSYLLASTGESGAEDIFLRFVNDTAADRIAVRAYLYWDAVTHAGVKEAFQTSYTYIKNVDASAFLYSIYADKDHAFIVTKVVATYYWQHSGLIKRFWSGAAAVTQAATGPGADITVQITAVIGCRTDPGTVFVLKGHRPLQLRWHPRRKAVPYASDPAYLDAVLAEEKGRREIAVPPMTLVVFRRENLAGYSVQPFEFVAQERKRAG